MPIMNVFSALEEKVRMGLLSNRVRLKQIRSPLIRLTESTRGVVVAELEGVKEGSRFLKQLLQLATLNEIDAVLGLASVAFRCRQHKVAGLLTCKAFELDPDVTCRFSIPFSEGDSVQMDFGNEKSMGQIIMPTGPACYAVRLAIDGKVRNRVDISKLHAAEGKKKHVYLEVPITWVGSTVEDINIFCEGLAHCGPDVLWRVFPFAAHLSSDSPKPPRNTIVDTDVSKLSGVFGGANEHSVARTYTLGKLLAMWAAQRRSLDLQGNWLGSCGLHSLSPHLQTLEHLKALNLSRNGIGPDGAQDMAEMLPLLPKLRRLWLARNALGAEGTGVIAGALLSLRQLKTLDLSCNEAGDEGFAALAGTLVTLTSLETLLLQGNSAGPDGAYALTPALRPLGRLIELDMSYNPFMASGAASLSQSIAVLTRLRQLRLRKVGLGPGGAARVCVALRRLTKLTALDVSKNMINWRGGASVRASLSRLPNMKQLDIGQNRIGARMMFTMNKKTAKVSFE